MRVSYDKKAGHFVVKDDDGAAYAALLEKREWVVFRLRLADPAVPTPHISAARQKVLDAVETYRAAQR